jgi:hypothetical protein
MKNISTGTGIALLAGAIVAYPIIDRVMPRAEAGATHVADVVAAATAQVPPEPTIVWYGNAYNQAANVLIITRAWSNGRVEFKMGAPNCNANGVSWGNPGCGSGCPDCQDRWATLADPAQGLTYRSDIDFNSKVDGSDLAQVLNDWGNAPRQDIPPSSCPLNLINP